MDENVKVSQLANLDMDCTCGHRHRVPIRHIYSGDGALEDLIRIAADFQGKNALLVGDRHTMPMAGDRAEAILKQAGLSVRRHLFARREHYLTDETAIGEMLVHMPGDTDLIVAVGSGTMNDISRVVSARCRIPYVIVGTAPSMDGYASSTSAVITGPEKVSVPLGSPYGIIADTDLMITAPDVMLSAGIGDVLGKHTTIADWRLAQQEAGEVYCPVIAGLIETACRRCQEGYAGVLARQRDKVRHMADTLIMAGVAISMYGTSRPASGSEHQLAHVWEVAAIQKGGDSALHGNFVGLGAIASILLYGEAGKEFDFASLGYALPSADAIEEILREAGGYALKEALGVDRALFLDSFTHAARANARYTILTYLDQRGRLDHYAKIVTDRVFG